MKSALILIPSYEPDTKIIDVVDSLTMNDYPILVVNDGSNSSFDRVFEQIKSKITYLSYEENKGKGYALKYGFSKIKELFPDVLYVITVDGDGQHSIDDINKMYEKLCETEEIVIGVRNFGKDIPAKSKFGNLYSRINRSLLTKQYLIDDQCGLRGYPVEYIPDLLKIKGDRYEYEMNQIVKLQMMHAKIVTLPIQTIYFDGNSTSHFAPIKDTIRIHSTILLRALPAVISNSLLISAIIVGIKYLSLPLFAIVYFSYLIMSLLYMFTINIIYDIKSVKKFIFSELIITIIKMSLCHLLLWLTIVILGWNYIAITPFIVVALSLLNILFAYVIYKIKKTKKD